MVATLLIVIGCILAPLSVVAVWAKNQVTNTDRYVATVARWQMTRRSRMLSPTGSPPKSSRTSMSWESLIRLWMRSPSAGCLR